MSEYTSTTVHEGSMRCRTEFTQGNAVFTTDVGTALGGKGEQPSPARISIASGYEEGKNGLSALIFHITVPHATTAEERSVLEAAVKGCPIGAAIAATVEKKISWTWAD